MITVPFGFDRASGVERQMEYFSHALKRVPNCPHIRFVVTRGHWPYPFATVYFLTAFLRILVDALFKRASLLHINLASRGSTARKLSIVLLSRLFRLPAVLHLHGADYIEFYRSAPKFYRALIRWMFGACERTLVLGASWRDFVVRELGVPPERVWTLPNAVPLPPAGAWERRGSGNGPCRLLFLGRLGERKGVPILLEALSSEFMRKLAWRAVVAGSGDVESYRAMASRLGIAGRIELPGRVDEETAAQLLGSSDVLVLPSRAENLPMAVLEGMAHGLAVVVTPVGAVAEVVTDGVDGLIVPVGAADALAQTIGRLVEDTPLRRRLGAAARQTIAARYDIETYTCRLVQIYTELL